MKARVEAVAFGLLLVLALGTGAWAQTTVTYLYNWYNEGIVSDAYREIIDDFNRTHPHIRVEGIEGGGYDRLTAMMAGGVTPDVVHFERSAVVEWMLQDRLMPIRTEAGIVGDVRSEFLESALLEVDWFGQIWAIPWDTEIRGLFWNVDLLEAAGLDAEYGPRSFAELDQWSQMLTRQGANTGYDQIGFVPWVNNWYPTGWFWAFGGGVYDYDRMEPTLDLPENVRAFHWMLEYVDRYGYAEASQAGTRDNFLAGRVGMMAEESGILLHMERSGIDLNVNAGYVPHEPAGRNGTWAGGGGHVIPAGAQNYEAALEFLAYLGSPQTQLKWYQLTHRLPTNIEAARIMYEQSEGPLRNLLDQMTIANARPPMWVYILVDAEGGLLPNRNRVLQRELTPEAALGQMQRLAIQHPGYQQLREQSGQ